MSGFNEVDNLDSLNAWATNVKLQVEACSQILRNPSKCESKEDFIEILKKIGMDFIRDANVKYHISEVCEVLQASKMSVADLAKCSNEWRFIEREMLFQFPQILDDLKLGLARLCAMAGPKAAKGTFSMNAAIEAMDNANMGKHN